MNEIHMVEKGDLTFVDHPKYYDKALNSDPGLLMMNVNHWLRQAGGEKRMIRTLDNNARAWLSDRYRRLDNIEIADALMPKILESKDIVLASADVTDSKLYIKAVFPSVRAEVKVGDVVEAGVIIQNSEIGMGALSGSLFINRLKCTNGMVVNDLGMRRNHVGSRLDVEGDGMYKLYSDKTIKLDNEAVISKLMDIVDAASTKENFERAVELMRESAKSEEMKDPEEGIVELAKIIGLNEGEAKQARRNLQEGRDYTRWGALNAVTALANDHESYDRATEIEELGGKVLNLSRSQWRTVVEAA